MPSISSRIDLLAHSKHGTEFWLLSPENLVFMDAPLAPMQYVGTFNEFMGKLAFYSGSYKLVPTECLKEIIREASGNPDKFRYFPLAHNWRNNGQGRIYVSGIERRDVERNWTKEKTANGSAIRSDEKAPPSDTSATEQPDLFVRLRSPRQSYSK